MTTELAQTIKLLLWTSYFYFNLSFLAMCSLTIKTQRKSKAGGRSDSWILIFCHPIKRSNQLLCDLPKFHGNQCKDLH